MNTVTLSIGQVIPWPHAPMGVAQIDELRRCNVQLWYAFKTGRVARPVVSAAVVAGLLRKPSTLLPMHNLLGKPIARPRTKSFKITPPPILERRKTCRVAKLW